MHAIARCTLVLATLLTLCASEHPIEDQTEAFKREKLFQRFKHAWTEAMAQAPELISPAATNALNNAFFQEFIRGTFDTMIYVHSSFGLWWNEIPAPTLRGTNALRGVEDFVSKHGWQMHTNRELILWHTEKRGEPIKNLPWVAIKDREFQATTDGGILYVPLRYGAVFEGFACSGVAYNSRTNRFPDTFRAFKHIGDHWYVWRQGYPPEGPKLYEGDAVKSGQ